MDVHGAIYAAGGYIDWLFCVEVLSNVPFDSTFSYRQISRPLRKRLDMLDKSRCGRNLAGMWCCGFRRVTSAVMPEI